MKRFLLTPIALAAAAVAHAAGVPPPIVTEQISAAVWTLYKGATKQPNQFTKLEDCQSVMRGLEGSLTVVSTTFECRAVVKTVVTLSAPPQPQGERQMLSCPAGSIAGAQWEQTRDYTTLKTPPFWKATTWAPKTMPKTACPPAPPAPTMHAGWPGIDEASIDYTVHHGSTQRLIDPPADFDCKTAADKVPGCTWPGPSGDGTGAFRNVSYEVLMGWFDPIVHPGMDNSAHLHQFVGNASINKDSTVESLLNNCDSAFRGGAVSCSSVWAPVFIDTKDGTTRRARAAILYYKKAAWADAKQIQPIPLGLKMIFGNPSATQFSRWGVTSFTCNGNAWTSDSFEPFTGGTHTIPNKDQCGPGKEVWMTAVAPNCWDGKNLDSADHQSHMAYQDSPFNAQTLSNGCQPHHPIQVSQVAALFIVPVGANDDPGRWVLTSDKPYVPIAGDTDEVTTLASGVKVKRGVTMHVDYFGAIPLEIQQKFLNGCVRIGLDCQAHMMGDGHTMRGFGGN